MIKRYIFLYCVAFFAATAGELCSAEVQEYNCDDLVAIKKSILSKLNEINSYQLDATVSIDDKVVTSQITGKQPDRLRITQKINKGSEELVNTIVFDGRNQWIESKFSNKILQVSKIRLSEVVDSGRLFDTGYYIQGAGIFGGEDFPSTVRILLSLYNLSAICSSNKIILSGYLDEKKFEEYAGKRKFAEFNKRYGYRDRFKKSFRYANMVFGHTDYLLHEYTLGPSNKSETMKIKFHHTLINIDGLEGEFSYQIPKGIDPTDITDELKQAFTNN
ncbi:MAG: hypothetical protein GY705_05395 [Bacteroidetes bacterium]|nr:hypothetical protein [Bacteroidota bacterium]